MTGKLGQSLRTYSESQGQPDFELEKFAINSLLSATHTSEMDEQDQKDIINKVKEAGQNDSQNSEMDNGTDDTNNVGNNNELGDDTNDGFDNDSENLEGGLEENLFLDKPKKNNMFQPNSNDILDEKSKGLWANIHAKKERGEAPAKPSDEDYPDKKQWNKLTKEDNKMDGGETNNYMFWQNLKNINDNASEILAMDMSEVDSLLNNGHDWAIEHVITSKDDVEEVYHFLEHNMESNPEMMSENDNSTNYMFFSSIKTILHASSELLEMDENLIDSILSNGHGWALDHIATAADDMEEVYHFLANTLNAYDGDNEGGYEDEYGNVESVNINEAEYHGRKVSLGKPTKGDVKKFKVFVKNKKGNVVKVNFGDPNMEIKRDNPKRRKSFRARHKCAQAKDRTTPKYWSCKMWSKKPVSKMVAEETDKELIKKGLQMLEKSSIFSKIKTKLKETFNQEDMNEPEVMPAPTIEPETKPIVQPSVSPSRRNKPFLPMPSVQPDPKAIKEGIMDYEVYHDTFSSAVQTAEEVALKRGYQIDENEWFNIVSTGKRKPSVNDTNRYSIPLYKDGKEQRKMLQIQVYNTGRKYELNCYIN